jgi:predicted ATP-grasp superfamily ATP-dependent carboligase
MEALAWRHCCAAAGRSGSRRSSNSQTDAALMLLSRNRERLGKAFRFVTPDAKLVDKSRFKALAERLALPVPAANRVDWAPGRRRHAPAVGFPALVKPAVREHAWTAAVADGGKAQIVAGPDEWAGITQQLEERGSDVVVRELMRGPETAIEGYHADVDANGATVGAFTARSARSRHTTASAPPLPALVQDLTGRSRSASWRPARRVVWCNPLTPRSALSAHAA